MTNEADGRSQTDRAEPDVSVLVATVAHRGDDARIAFRQIRALSDAGVKVIYVAPEPVLHDVDVAERIVVPRARGARRLRSWWEVMRVVRRYRDRVDVVLVHDLELVLPIRLTRPTANVIWDVHEDFVASVADRTWIPRRLRRPVAMLTSIVERVARRGITLILAERSYADRLGDWPVVPNTAVVPDALPARDITSKQVVYLGRISQGRGLAAMLELARRLGDDADVVLIGAADDDVVTTIQSAVHDGLIDWRGPVPNPEALEVVERSLVGLCLLEPLPNYLGSMPTKIHEYSARGIPTVSTPLPLVVDALRESGGGVVVPFDDIDALYDAVQKYLSDPSLAGQHGLNAHQWAHANHNWTADADRFVAGIRSLSRSSRSSQSAR